MASNRWFLSRDGLVKCPSCHAHVRFERADAPQACTFCATPITARQLGAPASRAAVGARGALVAASLFGLSVGSALGCASGPDPQPDPSPAEQSDETPSDDRADGDPPPAPEPADTTPQIAEYGAPANPETPPTPDEDATPIPDPARDQVLSPLYGRPPTPEPIDDSSPEDEAPAEPIAAPQPVPVALYGVAPPPAQPNINPTVTTNVVELRTNADGEVVLLLENVGLTVGSSASLGGTDARVEVLSCDQDTCEARLVGDATPVVGQVVVFGEE